MRPRLRDPCTQTDCGSNQRSDQKDLPSFHGPSLTIDFSDTASQLAGNVTVGLTYLAARSTALNILADGILAELGSLFALGRAQQLNEESNERLPVIRIDECHSTCSTKVYFRNGILKWESSRKVRIPGHVNKDSGGM